MNNITTYFTLAGPTNSHYKQDTNTYDFVNNQKQNLCVTIGDSWTYGKDLDNRLENLYGKILSETLNADWLNLGLPGIGNFFIAHLATELSQVLLKTKYKKVFVFCTFTEIGRQTDSSFDLDFDYMTWFDNHLTSYNSYYNLLYDMNKFCVNKIVQSLKDIPNVVLVFGNNYVDPIGFENVKLVEQSWLYYICEQYHLPYSEKCFCAQHGLLHLENLKNLQKNTNIPDEWHKQWMIELIDSANKRLDCMKDIKYFKNLHPLENEQVIWATKLLESL